MARQKQDASVLFRPSAAARYARLRSGPEQNSPELLRSGIYRKKFTGTQRLRFLHDNHFRVLPFDEGVTRLYSGRLPPKAIVITFDDGFADFYYQAYPLLRKHKMHATVYLTTHYCFNNRPIFGLITNYLLWSAKHVGVIPENALFGWNTPQDLSTAEGITHTHKLLNDYVEKQQMSTLHKDEIAEALASHLGIDYTAIRKSRILSLMTPEEVIKVHQGGMAIEMHTHRHRAPCDRILLTKEIHENRLKIHELTGRTPCHFCYPSGLWHRRMFPILKENWVESATTCDTALAGMRTSRFLLPRYVDTSTKTDSEFYGWISGASQFLSSGGWKRLQR